MISTSLVRLVPIDRTQETMVTMFGSGDPLLNIANTSMLAVNLHLVNPTFKYMVASTTGAIKHGQVEHMVNATLDANQNGTRVGINFSSHALEHFSER